MSLPDAVDTFFDRAGMAVPVYVPHTPAMVAGLAVAAAVLALGGSAVSDDRDAHRDATDVRKKHRWLVLGAVLLITASTLAETVQHKVYTMMMIRANKPHFAMATWLKIYTAAMR